MFRSRCRLTAGIAAAALGLALPLFAATEGQRQYLEGVSAYNNGAYELAASKLRAALKADAEEGIQKFKYTGLNPEDYFPHLYLGLSLQKLLRNDEALRELKESDRQGRVKLRAALNGILQRSLRTLEAQTVVEVRPTAPPPTRVPAPPTAAPARPTPTPQPVPTTPTLSGRTPRPSPTARATTVPRLETSPTPRATPQPTQSPAVAALREGIRTYFKGDYAAAARQLEPQISTSPLARLFLAYSLAAGQLLAETRDEEVVRRARREYAEALRSGASGASESLISPAVRNLLLAVSK